MLSGKFLKLDPITNKIPEVYASEFTRDSDFETFDYLWVNAKSTSADETGSQISPFKSINAALTEAYKTQDPELEVLFFLNSPKYSHIRGVIVRELLSYGGDVSGFVHPDAVKLLENKKK
jgi:hypothetical protein